MTEPQKTVQVNSTSSFFGRTGGAYIPPAKLRAMQAQIVDKTGEEYQRLTWEALKKSLNGLVNKVFYHEKLNNTLATGQRFEYKIYCSRSFC